MRTTTPAAGGLLVVLVVLAAASLLPVQEAAAAAASQQKVAAPAALDAAELSRRRQKPVVIVLGTAGSGTRTIHQILAAAGVWMHPFTNNEFDSKLFIKKIKHTPPFGMPKWRSGMIWETRHSPADYTPQQLSEDVRRRLEHAHQQVAAEFLADVPPDAAVWGWKEPQAIYTLPFLVQVFPNLRIIHQTRDGRDVGMSNLNSTSRRMTQPYQRHYVKLISGQDFNATELFTPRFSVAAGHTWAAVNANARRWALAQQGLGLQGRYSLTRLEDFCGDRAALHGTVRQLLVNAGLPHTLNDSAVAAAAATINATKCQTARWQAAWDSSDQQLSAAMRQLDADIADSLELFGYAAKTTTEWLDSADLQARLLQLQPVKAALSAGHKSSPQLVVVVFARPEQQQDVRAWLASVKAVSGSALSSRVLIVWQLQQPDGAAGQQTLPELEGAAGISLPLSAAAQQQLNSTQLLLQQQLQVLFALHKLALPVLLCDTHTHWVRDAAQHIQQAAAQQNNHHQQQHWTALRSACCDLVVSASVLPVDVLALRGTPAGTSINNSTLPQQLKTAAAAAAHQTGVGLALFNSTPAAGEVLRAMLRQQHSQQHLQQHNGSDAHGPRNRSLQSPPASLAAALQHQLLMANLKFSDPADSDSSSAAALLGVKATTAPEPLRVLLLPAAHVSQPCTPAATAGSGGATGAVVCDSRPVLAAGTEGKSQV